MREIKFRAWDDLSERFLDQWEISYDHDRSGCVFVSDNSQPFNRFGELSLQQYTGLKDKHGTEIYEGDIIRASDDSGELPGLFEVFWSNGHYFYKMIGDYPMRWYLGETVVGVIGNIYENSELLKPIV